MKKFIFLFCLYIPFKTIGQSSDLIDSVNDAIGPDYVFQLDSVESYHIFNLCSEASLTGNGKQVIVVASNADSTTELNKIFILARKDDDFDVIDSSAPFDIGYLGPRIEVKGSYLTIIHNFDKGFASTTYHFNPAAHRYILEKIRYSITEQNYPDFDHRVNFDQRYDVGSQTLTLKSSLYSYKDDKTERQKTKVMSKKLPNGTSLRLSHMQDPYDYDVFYTDGKVFDQMMIF